MPGLDARLLLDALADPVVACDSSDHVVYLNATAEAVLGWPAGELTGQPIEVIVPARLRSVGGQTFYRYVAARTSALEARTVRAPARRRDGVEIEIEVTAAIVRGENGAELLVASMRPLHEPFAVRPDESHRLVFENAPIGILHFDHRGVITACNDQFVQMIGSSRRQLLGLNMLTLPNTEIVSQVKAALGGKRGFFEGEYRSVTAGKLTPVRVIFAPILDGTTVRGGIGIVEDVTERKRIEAELQKAERLALMGTLAAGVAHEINNPLAYVLASVDLLEARDAGADISLGLKRVREGAERVRSIVNDLKTFARGGTVERRDLVDVGRVMDSAINLAWNEIKHRAKLTKSYGTGHTVMGDEARLGQVFLNLLVNAAQSIPEGDGQSHEIHVSTSQLTDGRVEVVVRDDGAGIPAELIGRIFDPFVTSKPVGVGTGLGLWICHGIITALNGEIAVESPLESGRGSRFRVLLPSSAQRERH
ncbi:MAG TPA: PAS domain S-box protein [Polyangia bacterium]|nr:PAS domain S-box protein [Polyangia bacterium]